MNTPAGSDVVKDCAEMRETKQPYTVAMAISDAQFYRAQPECILDARKAKLVIDTLLAGMERSQCFLKAAQKGEEVFVLRQQDRAAPDAIVAWADTVETHGCNAAKIDDAYRMAERWRDQPINTTKWPD